MQKNNLSSERISELEKTRRVLHTKQKQLNSLMIEICRLRELEKSLMPISQALEKLEKGTGRDELTPSELPFEATRIYQPVE